MVRGAFDVREVVGVRVVADFCKTVVGDTVSVVVVGVLSVFATLPVVAVGVVGVGSGARVPEKCGRLGSGTRARPRMPPPIVPRAPDAIGV